MMTSSTMKKVQNRVKTEFHNKKLDERFLGNDMEVVAFLMATEIERLHDELFECRNKYDRLVDDNSDFSCIDNEN